MREQTLIEQLQQGAKEISEKKLKVETKSKPAEKMAKGTAQIGDEPGEEIDETGKGVEQIQEKADQSAKETSEVSLQDSSLQEVQLLASNS